MLRQPFSVLIALSKRNDEKSLTLKQYTLY
ncbi:hypothetical protein VPHF86_0096 [Vibrio phage F86]